MIAPLCKTEALHGYVGTKGDDSCELPAVRTFCVDATHELSSGIHSYGCLPIRQGRFRKFKAFPDGRAKMYEIQQHKMIGSDDILYERTVPFLLTPIT